MRGKQFRLLLTVIMSLTLAVICAACGGSPAEHLLFRRIRDADIIQAAAEAETVENRVFRSLPLRFLTH